MKRLTVLVCAALTGLACLGLPATASAQEVGEAEYAPTMLVLDASGSMTAADPAGGTKIAAAKRAVHTVVESVPEGSEVGLTAYGTGTGSTAGEKAAGCQDVSVLRPPGPVDKTAIGAAVDRVVPRGYTPIGRSLQVAADTLPKQGPRSIVLVSDGADTCAPPDPCEVVEDLAGQGIDLVVHAVGFGVDERAREQLTCIAQASGGTYTDAPDAGALQRVLPRVTTTAVRNYQPSGTLVRGSLEPSGAPTVQPGQYLDSVGPAQKQFYAVDVPEGATLYASATISYPRQSESQGVQGVDIAVRGKDGEGTCTSDFDNGTDTEDGEVLTAQATLDSAAESDDEDCSGAGRYVVEVARDTTDPPLYRLPLELGIGVEPAAERSGLPGEAAGGATYTDPGGPVVPVTGGNTFGTAARLNGSGHYTEQLRFGEFVFYKVRVEWGQMITYQVRYDALPGDRNLFADTSARLYAPFRGQVSEANGSYLGEADTISVDQPSLPVRYRNRESQEPAVQAQSVAGTYYLAVKLGSNDNGPIGDAVPVSVDVNVQGKAEPGPDYREGTGRTGGFGTGNGDNGTAAEPQPANASSGLPTGWIIGGSIGAVALVGAALATLLLRRRGRGG